MSDEERSLVHTSEFLVGDSAGTNLDRVTDVAARMSEALESHPEIFDGLGDDEGAEVPLRSLVRHSKRLTGLRRVSGR